MCNDFFESVLLYFFFLFSFFLSISLFVVCCTLFDFFRRFVTRACFNFGRIRCYFICLFFFLFFFFSFFILTTYYYVVECDKLDSYFIGKNNAVRLRRWKLKIMLLVFRFFALRFKYSTRYFANIYKKRTTLISLVLFVSLR